MGRPRQLKNPICLVIDEQEALRHTEELLSTFFPQYSLRIFESGPAFIDCMDAALPSEPLLVLLDLQDRKADTLRVLPLLKQHPLWHYVPVIVFPRTATAEDIVAYYNAGANSCVVRAQEDTQLVKSLEVVLEYWLEVNVRSTGLPFGS